jgi:hypothetical protein
LLRKHLNAFFLQPFSFFVFMFFSTRLCLSARGFQFSATKTQK